MIEQYIREPLKLNPKDPEGLLRAIQNMDRNIAFSLGKIIDLLNKIPVIGHFHLSGVNHTIHAITGAGFEPRMVILTAQGYVSNGKVWSHGYMTKNNWVGLFYWYDGSIYHSQAFGVGSFYPTVCLYMEESATDSVTLQYTSMDPDGFTVEEHIGGSGIVTPVQYTMIP